MKIKSKTIELALLDKEKVYAQHSYIQVLNLVLPIILVSFFGISFLYLKKRGEFAYPPVKVACVVMKGTTVPKNRPKQTQPSAMRLNDETVQCKH